MHKFFKKSVDKFEVAQKHANFKLGVQYPLKTENMPSVLALHSVSCDRRFPFHCLRCKGARQFGIDQSIIFFYLITFCDLKWICFSQQRTMLCDHHVMIFNKIFGWKLYCFETCVSFESIH